MALGFFLAEAITLAASKIGGFALVPLSQEFVAAGAPEVSSLQTLGDFLYRGVDRQGYLIHNLFLGVGGALWYSLLLRSGSIPLVLSVWGLGAVGLLTLAMLLTLFEREFAPVMVLAIPYVPYEIVLGVWLIVKGFN